MLHGFHYLKPGGIMTIILPHGVLFRGGVEARIRKKLLEDGHIDAVIGPPANLLFSTSIPVCILVLKKCKKADDVLFINAAEYFEKDKCQNHLSDEHIKKIVETYQYRRGEERFSRRVPMREIADNDFNLNISRYISTAEPEADLAAVHKELTELDERIAAATAKHNGFLRELGLPEIGYHTYLYQLARVAVLSSLVLPNSSEAFLMRTLVSPCSLTAFAAFSFRTKNGIALNSDVAY